MSRPATSTRPSVATSSRSKSLRNVDFPEPEGPTRKTNSPLAISRESVPQGDDIALVGLGDVFESNHVEPRGYRQAGRSGTSAA